MNAEFEITNITNRQEGVIRKIPFSEAKDDFVVIRSALTGEAFLNEHLVWLWGRLKHERRYLKNLQQDGAILTVRIKGATGNIELYPNGAEMLHLLQAHLLIERM